jgi:GR25 family glycosyltransferase involved in LPS biosynthesis
LKSYVIHLKDRIDRFTHLEREMNSLYPGEWEVWPAVKHERGSFGLSMSYRQIFEKSIKEGLESVLTFEDDVKFSSPKSREWFETCERDLPDDWGILLGGVYTWKTPVQFKENLFECKQFSGTHMVLWSRKACEKMLEHRPEDGVRPFDIDKFVGKTDLRTFICNPMVAYQMDSYSDVFKDTRDLSSMLIDKTFLEC